MTAQRLLGKPHSSARTAGVSGEAWGVTDFEQGGREGTGKPLFTDIDPAVASDVEDGSQSMAEPGSDSGDRGATTHG